MNCERFLCLFFFLRLYHVAHGGPSGVQDVHRAEAIVYPVAAEHDEIVNVLIYGKLGDFWLCDDDALLASEFLKLGFDISKCARDTQSSRQDAVWTVEHLLLLTSDLAILICNWYSLEGLSLIDLTSIVLDSVELSFFIGSVVL